MASIYEKLRDHRGMAGDAELTRDWQRYVPVDLTARDRLCSLVEAAAAYVAEEIPHGPDVLASDAERRFVAALAEVTNEAV